MNQLKAISSHYVIQTTKFMRLAVRKGKWLISQQVWEEERDFYLDCLRVYMGNFSKDNLLLELKERSNGEPTLLLLEWLKTEIVHLQDMLKGNVKREIIEKFEIILSLTYALQLSIFEKGQLPLFSYPMTEKEMSWYIEEYLEGKNMGKDFLILNTKGEKIA